MRVITASVDPTAMRELATTLLASVRCLKTRVSGYPPLYAAEGDTNPGLRLSRGTLSLRETR
jgi:hypothetical protein